ncbi:rRNA pseudouridine synthase [Candidatus Babeliales bacterium]|nr:rRNA pseudouridine synthase [Candidatus Babeliales bacterium]
MQKKIQLNKYLAYAGVCSRRKADDLIKTGKVKINGKVVIKSFAVVSYSDDVLVNGNKIFLEEKVYIILNKPKGYVTTASDEKGRSTVLDLINISKEFRLYPVGRLDKDTSGLIILTNDGELAQKLAHPKYGVEKVYSVDLNKLLTNQDLLTIQKGLRLNDGFIRVDKIVRLKNKRTAKVVLHSGKNRIVRRIFQKLNYEVIKLDRVVYAGITKKGLDVGKWRYLSKEEIKIISSVQAS